MMERPKSDGSYPFDDSGKWRYVLYLPEAAAKALLAENYEVVNKCFRVIPRHENDYSYDMWDLHGRKKDYFRGALALYKHDFNFWLIEKL